MKNGLTPDEIRSKAASCRVTKATAQEALSTAEEAVRDTASDLAQVQTLVQTATDQANAASSSASAAATSAQAADNSANLAQDWAVKMDGMVTDDGTEEGTPVDYSSKYYAQQAAASASAASDSEDAAASSASAAASSQQAAATSAGQASTSATNAAGSATAAASSATAAQNAQNAAEDARDLAQQYASANAHAVVYDPQTLTAEQQQQARTNIGAISADQVPDPDLTPYLTKADAQTTYLGINAKAVSAGSADTAAACTGNAATATKLQTAWTISLSGDATGSVSIDGSANATLNLTIANRSVTNGMLAASSVTFSKVASGDVATQAEAEAGTSNSAFMTPLRVAQAINANSSSGNPSGTIIAFAGGTVPDGYLLCNGANVSRTTYANLFAAIGTAWGSGDGSTTFTLPNFNGRFLEGTTSAGNVGDYLSAGLPNITGELAGSYSISGHTDGPFGISSSKENYMGVQDRNQSNYWFTFNAARCSSVYGRSTTVQPPSGSVYFCIKI